MVGGEDVWYINDFLPVVGAGQLDYWRRSGLFVRIWSALVVGLSFYVFFAYDSFHACLIDCCWGFVFVLCLL